MARAEHEVRELARSLTLPRLVFYGVGTVLGAGIFVVIGEVIGEAGPLTPVAYILAGTIALTTALSYAEISARIPSAGGPLDYVETATGSRRLGSFTGWMLMLANTVSAATITTGFINYLGIFADVQDWLVAVLLVGTISAIAILGIKQSSWFMTVTTLIGIATLISIVWATRDGLLAAPAQISDAFLTLDAGTAAGLFAGAFLAIYSFIGFGDMALTAEEVKKVERNLPRAIMIVLAIVFAFYLLVSVAVVGAGPTDAIAAAEAPLVAAVEREGWPGWPVGVASLFVIVNGALTQIIGASRILLDIGRDGRGAPGVFGGINNVTRTPVVATLAIATVTLVLAVFVPLKSLAEATSLVVLIVFMAVNASLFVLKREGQPSGVPDVWKGVPVLGVLTCAGAMVAQAAHWTG